MQSGQSGSGSLYTTVRQAIITHHNLHITQPFDCFISSVNAMGDYFEICDADHSVRCHIRPVWEQLRAKLSLFSAKSEVASSLNALVTQPLRVKRARVTADLTLELLEVEFPSEGKLYDLGEVAHHAGIAKSETLRTLLDFVKM